MELPHTSSDVTPFEVLEEGGDSQTTIPLTAANPFGDEDTHHTSVSDHYQNRTRHTAPVQPSHRLQHPKLKMKVERDVGKQKSKSSLKQKLDSQRASDFDEYDVITSAEAAEVLTGRERSSTDPKEPGEERERKRETNTVASTTEGNGNWESVDRYQYLVPVLDRYQYLVPVLDRYQY